MNNIVLMAGSGKRFTDAGYKQSKPLIPVSGKPMILQAVKCMPKADTWIFVVRKEHLREQEVIETLRSVSRNVHILVDPNPIGQLNSCLVARQHYEKKDPMFVGACDLGMVWNRNEYAQLLDSGADVVSWSFTRQPNLTRNPSAWGWLKVDSEQNVLGVSVKVPISENPYNDYAITGDFTFRSGRDFQRIADELMRRGETVKGEYYIDSMLKVAIDLGYKVKHFPVQKYIGWGVPADYEEYTYWERVFRKEEHPEARYNAEYEFWKGYFA